MALRVTGVMGTLPKIKAGGKVVTDVTEEGLLIEPASRKKGRFCFPYTESELLADLTPEKVHADELAIITVSGFGD